jgi:monothiol glutaredoxin
MRKYSLDYQDIDIVNHPDTYEEMVRKSGRKLAPCVEIDGVMLADVSGEEVENYLLSNHMVISCDRASDGAKIANGGPEAPISLAPQTIRFF